MNAEPVVVVELSGGIAEAIHRGERRAPLWFAVHNCGMRGDLSKARLVLDDLRRLTGVRHEMQDFADRTLTMLEANWKAVELLA